MKNVLSFIAVLCIFISPYISSAQDAEGCKDHAAFNRMPNFNISQCSENFASLDLVIGAGDKKQTEEGTRTHIDYIFNTETQQKYPSWLQIAKNYENAIFKLGGTKIFRDNNYATYKISGSGKETYVMLTMNSGTDLQVEQYYMDVLEKEEMKQEITGSDMFKALNSSGFIALYINFETGKSLIMPESQPIVGQIAQMLKDNPTLKISIEGHTDNVGTAAANLTLSDNRAKSVMNALVAKGIDKSRLSSKGWGQTKPAADNSTNAGKAKNRRVEIVKM